MSIDEHKDLVRRFIDAVWNQMNPEAVDQFVAPDVIDRSGRGSGQEAVKQTVRLFATAFPDWHTTIEDLIAEGDNVVMRGVVRGTHQGTFMGIVPTGGGWRCQGSTSCGSGTARSWSTGRKGTIWG